MTQQIYLEKAHPDEPESEFLTLRVLIDPDWQTFSVKCDRAGGVELELLVAEDMLPPEVVKALMFPTMAALDYSEVESLAEARKIVGDVISHPRWLSIGAINTDVEVRFSRKVYERAVEFLRGGPR